MSISDSLSWLFHHQSRGRKAATLDSKSFASTEILRPRGGLRMTVPGSPAVNRALANGHPGADVASTKFIQLVPLDKNTRALRPACWLPKIARSNSRTADQKMIFAANWATRGSPACPERNVPKEELLLILSKLPMLSVPFTAPVLVLSGAKLGWFSTLKYSTRSCILSRSVKLMYFDNC